jgi:hypothetical protein
VQVSSSHQAANGGADVKLDSLAAAERKQTRRSIDIPSSPLTTNLFFLLAYLEEEDGYTSAQPGVHTEVAASTQVVQTIDMSAVLQLPDGVGGVEEGGGQQVREELWEWDMSRENRAKLMQAPQQTAADRHVEQTARGAVGGHIDGQPCEVFVDSGASTNFVSGLGAEQHGLQLQQLASSMDAVMADGRNEQPLGIVDVTEMDVHVSTAAAAKESTIRPACLKLTLEAEATVAIKGSTVRPACLKLSLATSTTAQLSQERPMETVVDASPLLHCIKDLAVRDAAYQMTISRAAHSGLTVEDGLLYSPDRWLFAPDDAALNRRLLRELRDAPKGGHLGMIEIGREVADLSYWYGMQHDIEDYLRGCVTGVRSLPSQLSPAGKLQPFPIPQRCWETISVDVIGRRPKTNDNDIDVPMVVDKLSKLVQYVTCHQSITAEGPTKLDQVWSEVIRYHGVPSCISDMWRALLRIMRTYLRMSALYHPQSNGLTERANHVLEDALRANVVVTAELASWTTEFAVELFCKVDGM